MLRAQGSVIPFWLIKSRFFLHLPSGARKMILAELSAISPPLSDAQCGGAHDEVPLGCEVCWPSVSNLYISSTDGPKGRFTNSR